MASMSISSVRHASAMMCADFLRAHPPTSLLFSVAFLQRSVRCEAPLCARARTPSLTHKLALAPNVTTASCSGTAAAGILLISCKTCANCECVRLQNTICNLPSYAASSAAARSSSSSNGSSGRTSGGGASKENSESPVGAGLRMWSRRRDFSRCAIVPRSVTTAARRNRCRLDSRRSLRRRHSASAEVRAMPRRCSAAQSSMSPWPWGPASASAMRACSRRRSQESAGQSSDKVLPVPVGLSSMATPPWSKVW
mmetsp:Transcript_68947/g.211509  ORF Transcript_68947/g.211509 Transcript_68947/m.211509 type:complete len:254 (-) Transcript_68947:88-849(-)